MAVSHASLGLVGLALLGGSLAMLFFVILAGVSQTPPLNNTYFLQAETRGIPGARVVSQWTYFYICGEGNLDCGPPYPAMAFGSAWNGTAAGAPGELVGDFGGGSTSNYYWYMWRFGWVLYLIALFFEVMAFFAGFAACCGRLGAALAGLVALIALFFYTIAVSLMTATFVKARNAFLASGRPAHVGTYAFGFSWGAWAALLLAVAFFFVGMRGGNRGDYVRSSRGRFFGRRNRSTKSRRSVELGSRRVKDEYS